MELEKLELAHEGAALVGEVARPQGAGPHPAVLVMANAIGLGNQVRAAARALAALGYIAICTDMYGGGRYYHDATEAADDYLGLMNAPDLLRARVVAWYQAAAALSGVDAPRIAAIGYCFGGCCVLELARSGVDVKAVVSYHGILTTHNPAQPGVIKGKVAAYCGALDPYAPADTITGLRSEMDAAGARCDITVFGNVFHSFTDPEPHEPPLPGIGYDAVAHKVSWAGTLVLLDEVLG